LFTAHFVAATAAAALVGNFSLTFLLLQDFYDKYEAYMTVMHERKERTIR
jgi:hypothetical protein